MPSPVLKRVGYVGGLLLLSGVLILAAQEDAQSKPDQATPASTPSAAQAPSPQPTARRTASKNQWRAIQNSAIGLPSSRPPRN